MTADCSMYRNLIPRALAGDLSASEQESLDRHLVECEPCNREQTLYAQTLRLMRSAGDVPTPRHFFVYGEQSENPWQIFRRLSRAWQFATAAAVILVGALAVLAAARVHVRTQGDTLVMSFGEPAPARLSPSPSVDAAAIEARILKDMEANNRREKLELIGTLRAEIEKSSRSLTDRQRRTMQAALSEVEKRLTGRVAAAESVLEARSDKSIADLYQVVSAERATDLSAIDSRINRLALRGEVRGSQTDAILETLLQVADLNMK